MTAFNPDAKRRFGDGEHPREIKQRKDTLLRERMDTLLPEIDVINMRLEMAHEEDLQTEEDTITDIITSAIQELDEQWPFSDHFLVVSGKWYRNSVKASQRLIKTEEVYESVFHQLLAMAFRFDTNLKNYLPG